MSDSGKKTFKDVWKKRWERFQVSRSKILKILECSFGVLYQPFKVRLFYWLLTLFLMNIWIVAYVVLLLCPTEYLEKIHLNVIPWYVHLIFRLSMACSFWILGNMACHCPVSLLLRLLFILSSTMVWRCIWQWTTTAKTPTEVHLNSRLLILLFMCRYKIGDYSWR